MSQNPPRPPRRARLPEGVRGALHVLEGALTRRHPAPPPPRDGGAAAEASLVVASYNIHRCIGVDRRFDPVRVAAVIEELGADIVALQEADRRFGHRVGLLDLSAIERRTGLMHVPISQTPGGHGWRGNALLVRGGAATLTRRVTLPGAEPRGALIVELALPQGPLRVVTAHLGLLRRHRALQAAHILAELQDAAPMPMLLMGDLNEWRPGVASSLAPLAPLFGPFGPPLPSFPSRKPFLALDRILAHPHGLITAAHVHDSPLARQASDHLPLTARIVLASALSEAA
ncbi:endonuclease/exonuclease/phosphatase family protein [Plastoroseomonas arctica]|uniref:EEP domain-containing protein n=1 Tax=Plastoroseomonas arctica TaxID=1509237 RepID=A0AAF1K157_9PROT|nr:endonuclease/exonuclease/phosphatase family protein [Plastoroseomonas arctica]MBR0654425.1 EEP domain-containing protein [Plastoroseomonas arctica]